MSRARDLSQRLAMRAPQAARHYLSNGRPCGAYWIAGDVRNTQGGSLWVRLAAPGAGRWRDEAEDGAEGDLLDLVRMRCGFATLGQAMDEAERFLTGARAITTNEAASYARPRSDRTEAARRLYARAGPLPGTPGEAYLIGRGLSPPHPQSLRFLGRTVFAGENGALSYRPALIAAICDSGGALMGVHRTFITQERNRWVVLERRFMGCVRGHATPLGGEGETVLAGEGLETVLSLSRMVTGARLYATLSAANLAAWIWPSDARRVFIAIDRDANRAGEKAAFRLAGRLKVAGLDARFLFPRLGDFNDDLRMFGAGAMKHAIARQRG